MLDHELNLHIKHTHFFSHTHNQTQTIQSFANLTQISISHSNGYFSTYLKFAV